MKPCSAKTRKGTPCQKQAGWGTTHVGVGRCRLHGGATPIKHGLYSKYTPESIRFKTAEFLQADPLDLTSELALLRALLAEFLARYERYPLDAAGISVLSGLIVEVGKLVERIVKIKNDSALTAAEITYLAARAADVISRYIDDPTKRKTFLDELFAGVPAADRNTAIVITSQSED